MALAQNRASSFGPSARTKPCRAIHEPDFNVGDIAMTPPAILDRYDIELDKNEKHAAIAP
jgi:hypothetical protein